MTSKIAPLPVRAGIDDPNSNRYIFLTSFTSYLIDRFALIHFIEFQLFEVARLPIETAADTAFQQVGAVVPEVKCFHGTVFRYSAAQSRLNIH